MGGLPGWIAPRGRGGAYSAGGLMTTYERWHHFREFDIWIAAILWADLENELIETLLYLNPGQRQPITLHKLTRLIESTEIDDIIIHERAFVSPLVTKLIQQFGEFQKSLKTGQKRDRLTRDELLAFAEMTGEKPAFLFPEKSLTDTPSTSKNKKNEDEKKYSSRERKTHLTLLAIFLAEILKSEKSNKLGTIDKPNISQIAKRFAREIDGLSDKNLENRIVPAILAAYRNIRDEN
jgi:hypothetical protein